MFLQFTVFNGCSFEQTVRFYTLALRNGEFFLNLLIRPNYALLSIAPFLNIMLLLLIMIVYNIVQT